LSAGSARLPRDEALEALRRHPAIWRGDSISPVARPSIPTGFAALDALLPGGGWPQGALTEILCPRPGAGELRLVVPALADLANARRWIVWVAPPGIPYAPALAAAGVPPERALWINTAAMQDAYWSAEQALRSGACGAVLLWAARPDVRMVRRLQAAAEAGGAWGVLYRSAQAAEFSPAPLRLAVTPSRDQLAVQVLKRRGAPLAAPVVLETGHATGATPG
jgi:hypothetical protein